MYESSTGLGSFTSVARLVRKSKLHPRTKSGDGGLFAYHDAQSDLLLISRWDGAGLTDSGKIVLFEHEAPGFEPLHIQGHLNLLLFMIRSGEVIAKLVWIVPEARYHDLDKTIFLGFKCGRPVLAPNFLQWSTLDADAAVPADVAPTRYPAQNKPSLVSEESSPFSNDSCTSSLVEE